MAEKLRLEDVIAAHWSAPRQMAWYEGEWWTAERVFRLVEENVKQLQAAGFGAGDRIVTMLPNSPSFLALCMAAWKMRGSVTPLNTLAGPQALGALIKHSMPAVIVAAPALKEHAEGLRGLPVPFVFLEATGPLPEFKAAPSLKSSEDCCSIFYTSGTTGTPKGVPLTHMNILTCLDQALKQVLPDIGEQTMLNVLPNFHTLGCVVSGFMPLFVGIPQVIRSNFLPVEGTMRAIDEGGATLLVTVPTLLHFLCGAAAKTGWKPRRVKYVVSGGDRLVPSLRGRIAQLLGGRPIEGYGLTECSPILAAQATGGSPEGSVGPLLEDIEYQLRDVDGSPAAGDEGVLWVKGPNVASGYFNAPQITAEKFQNGWFNTGDMVRVDEKRNVFIQERVSDLIIVGGFNVYPQEVEAVLNSNPKVMESAAVGVSRSVTGQIVRAFVILKEGVTTTSSELADWCRERLPHYKVPRSIKLVTDLPRNALGKVLRRKLREDDQNGDDE